MPGRRILHPTDFSSASRSAFGEAVRRAKAEHAPLTVVHVLDRPVIPVAGDVTYLPPKRYEDLFTAARTYAQRQVDRLVARAKAAGVRADSRVLDGIVHLEIARAAARSGAALIVMGTHGRTGLARAFLGSVAARVIASAPCPVLTVRGGERARRHRAA